MFSEAPLPHGLHQLRPLTFFEAALYALRRSEKFRKALPEYPGPPTKTVLTGTDRILGDPPG